MGECDCQVAWQRRGVGWHYQHTRKTHTHLEATADDECLAKAALAQLLGHCSTAGPRVSQQQVCERVYEWMGGDWKLFSTCVCCWIKAPEHTWWY